MKLTLAYSPCPNDTFIFDAIANNRIDTMGFDFDIHIADVEELNKDAFSNKYDISKISYHAYTYLQDSYQILDSGSALGRGNGPLLISKTKLNDSEIENSHIAIPGKFTTANFLMSIAYPKATNKTAILFSDIEQGINNNEFDAGVIIHENRFTYSERGFVKLIDLGEFWENKTNCPIPLGGIAINRNLPKDVKLKFNEILNQSIIYAMNHPQASYEYIKEYAQEIHAEVIEKHIKLFVNSFSVSLGIEGKNAIETMLVEAKKNGLIKNIRNDNFVL